MSESQAALITSKNLECIAKNEKYLKLVFLLLSFTFKSTKIEE